MMKKSMRKKRKFEHYSDRKFIYMLYMFQNNNKK